MPHLLSTSHIQCIVKQFIIKLMYQNFSLLESGNFRDLTHAPMSMECFIHVKDHFEKKNLVLPIEKFWFLALARNNYVTTPYYPFCTPLHLCGCLQEVENNGKF